MESDARVLQFVKGNGWASHSVRPPRAYCSSWRGVTGRAERMT